MNCKPNDLAIVVVSSGSNLGKIVKCVRLSPHDGTRMPNGEIRYGPVWEIDRPLESWSGTMIRFCHDAVLRPIRDQKGDEPFIKAVPVDDQIEVLRKINRRNQKERT